MKCPILLLSILVGGSVFAQNHHTFPNVNATFRVTSLCADPLNMPQFYEQVVEYTYAFEPVFEMDSLSWSALEPDMGLIAVNGDRIYLRGGPFLEGDSTILLYDLSLEIGDTAYFDQYHLFDHVTVTHIDTMLVSGFERRRLTLSNGDQWVQGIGSLVDPLRPIYPIPFGCEFSSMEFCGSYLDDEDEPYTICLDMHVGMDRMSVPSIMVHRLPEGRSFMLEGTQSGMRYVVVDPSGRYITSGTFNSAYTFVHLRDVSAGLHLLRYETGTLKLAVE